MITVPKHYFLVLVTLLLTLAGLSLVSAWIDPTAAAPNNNVAAPINVGATDQVKNAGLSVNALAVFGNMIVSTANGYLNFGSTAGTGGYGIRDNAGAMEVKNSNGGWARFATTTSGGAMEKIAFTDGTVQSTAATTTPSGSWCGAATYTCTSNNLNNVGGCGTKNSMFLCKGYNLAQNQCPAGYTLRSVLLSTSGSTSWGVTTTVANYIQFCSQN